jgi:Transglycosylase SLT domain/Tape measure protein
VAANRIYLQVDLSSDDAQKNVNQLNESIKKTGEESEKSSDKATKSLNKVTVSVHSVTDSFSAMSAAISGLGIERLAVGLVTLSSDFNRIQLSMQAFTGSAKVARDLFESIRVVAQGSTFGFKDLEQTGRQMLAFGIAAKDIPGYLQNITDKAASTGASLEDLNGVVAVMGRIMEKDFVGAMDLLRKLPQQAYPIVEALRKKLSAELGRPFSTEDVKKAITDGILNPLKTVALIAEVAGEGTKGFGAKVVDSAKAFKNLGDELKNQAQLLANSFNPAIVKLAENIGTLLVPLQKFAEYLESLPEGTKEWIVNIAAAAVAVATFAAAWKILFSVLGPGIEILKGVVSVLKGFAVALANPEMLIGIAALAGLVVLLYKTVPAFREGADSLISGLGKYADQAVAKFKSLFATVRQEAAKPPQAAAVTGLVQESETIYNKQLELVTKLQDEASAKLLQAYASPMEAVTLKYATLFRELNEQIKAGAITEPHAAELRAALGRAQVSDTNTEQVKKRKQQVDEYVSYWTERVKGSADAQIAYIEAQDAQSLRGKVDAINKVTELRISSEEDVAKIQKERLRSEIQDYADYIYQNRAYLMQLGVSQDDLNKAMADRRIEMAEKIKAIDQKAADEAQKYRFEGWKKTNDAIIEDQKRVFDAFRDIYDQFFDAITGKAGTVGKAIGDMFKKFALNEAKETFSSMAAGFSTAAAGYGTPEESMPGHGRGLLGILLRRGTPPQSLPPGGIPEPLGGIPGVQQANIEFAKIAGGTVGGAVNSVAPIVESSTRFDTAATKFAIATDQFALTVQQQASTGGPLAAFAPSGGGGGMMAGTQPSGAMQSLFAQATAKYGLPPGLVQAVAQTETAGYNATAVSPKGAVGVMQLMPGTAADLGVTDRTNAAQSVEGGAKYLSQLMQRFGGDIPKVLAAYNAGPGRVAAGGPLPAETQGYVAKAMGYLKQWTGAGGGSGGGAAAVPFMGPQLPMPGMDELAALPMTARPTYAPTLTMPTEMTPVTPEQLAGLPVSGSSTSQQFPSVMRLPESVTQGAVPQLLQTALGTSDVKKVGGLLAAGLSLTSKAAAGQGGAAGAKGLAGNLAGLKDLFGIGAGTALGGTTARSVLTSRGTGMLLSAGGMALASQGLQKRVPALTVAGGAATGLGLLLQSPKLLAQASAQGGGMAGALGAGLAVGAGGGLIASGLQKGGFGGLGMDVGGGALAGAGIGFMFGGPVGAAIGAGVGAAVGAVAGTVRLFIKTEQEKIRAQIKQVYGIDISNRQLLTQIQQVIDQTYGGNVAVGIRSQQVQDIVRLYALSSGQAANLPRPEYSATIAQSAAGGNQLQAVYQGGQLVQNPYSGPTTYQYQTAVTTAEGLKAGTTLGVPGATGLVNQGFANLPTAQFTGQVVSALQSNPAAVGQASAAAARAGDSRLTTTAAMLEPLTSLS